MCQNFIYNITFHQLLHSIDQELANKSMRQGCLHCGGKLHQAIYPRSPFGLPEQFHHLYNERYSLCCSTCRKRTTPSSVRFFGRRWFPAPLLILISALGKGANDRRCKQVKRHFGITVSKSTWQRWCRWWRDSFVATPFWKQARGLLISTQQEACGHFLHDLLDRFQGTFIEKICYLLRFFLPLTAGALRAV